MYFKLEDANGVLQNVNVETNPAFLETQDSTLDTGSVTLEYSDDPTPIPPNRAFLVDNGTDYIPFIVVNDNVTVVKKTPTTLYKHELTLTQNTEKQTKRLMRNSVFSRNVSERRSATCTALFSTKLDNKENPIPPDDLYRFQTTHSKKKEYKQTFKLVRGTSVKDFKLSFTSQTTYFNDCYLDTLSAQSQQIDPPYDRIYKQNDANTNSGSLRTENTMLEGTVKIIRYESGVWTTSEDINIGTNINKNGEIIIDDSTIINRLFGSITNDTSYEIRIEDLTSLDTSTFYLNNGGINIQLSGGWGSLTPRVFEPLLTSVHCDIFINSVYMTLYDVLETLLKQAKKKYFGLSTYSDSKLFTLPVSGNDYDTLKQTEAPEFSFTQQDLLSCVTEVLSYLDAVPRIDKNGVLHIEYLNDNSKERINNPKFTDLTANLTENYYVDRMVTEYQNARQTNMEYSPIETKRKRPIGKNYGIVNRADWILQTEHPIDVINKLYVTPSSVTYSPVWQFIQDVWDTEYQFNNISSSALDISFAIFEEKEYALLSYGDAGKTFPNKNNTIYYTQGTKEITFGDVTDTNGNRQNSFTLPYAINFALCNYLGLVENDTSSGALPNQYKVLGTTPSVSQDIYTYTFQVGYYGIHDGKFAIESPDKKYDGDIMISQQSGQIQLNRMGLNMLGTISKLGNKDLNVTMPITSFSNRIKKGSIWKDSNGDRYIANKVKTTIGTSTDKCICEVEFVKNFNELSLFTRVDQARRFYEIDSSLVQKGYEYIVERMYFSTKSLSDVQSVIAAQGRTDIQSCQYYCAVRREATLSFATGLFIKRNAYNIKMCALRTYTLEGDTEPLNLAAVNKSNNLTYTMITCPMHSYGAGNMLCFETGFDDAINGGDRVVTRTDNFFNASQRLCVPTLYTNEQGFADKFDIFFVGKDIHSYFEYPLVDENVINGTYGTLMARVNEYHYYKKPNEIFRFNYEIACLQLPGEEIFFGDKFISENTLIIGEKGFIGASNLKFYINKGNDYSIIDKKAHGESVGNTFDINGSVQTTGTGHFANISISWYTPAWDYEFDNWCLADSDGNILICGNLKTPKNANSGGMNLIIFPSRYRL